MFFTGVTTKMVIFIANRPLVGYRLRIRSIILISRDPKEKYFWIKQFTLLEFQLKQNLWTKSQHDFNCQLSFTQNSGILYLEHTKWTPAVGGLTFIHKFQSALIFSSVIFQDNFINPSIFSRKLREEQNTILQFIVASEDGVCILKALWFIALPSRHTLNKHLGMSAMNSSWMNLCIIIRQASSPDYSPSKAMVPKVLILYSAFILKTNDHIYLKVCSFI